MTAQWVAMGLRIAQARRYLGLRRREDINPIAFAEIVGVAPVTVYRWESGEKPPGRVNIAKIAGLCGVSAHWLLTGNGEMIADDDGLSDSASGAKRAPVKPSPSPSAREVSKSAIVERGKAVLADKMKEHAAHQKRKTS